MLIVISIRNHLRSSLSVPITEHSPIARGRVGKKFDICYIPFTKYSALQELEAKHRVHLGYAYRTKDSARLFSHYTEPTGRIFTSSHFFSFLMDGSTDKGNIEDESIVLQYCNKDEDSQEIILEP